MAGAPPKLDYASDRLRITRDADGLLVHFPAAPSGGFWFRAAWLLGLSLLCLAFAVCPGDNSRFAGLVPTHSGGVASRVIGLGFAAVLAVVFLADFRTRQLQPTLVLRGGTMHFSRPGRWGFRTVEYPLPGYVDVGLEQDVEGIHLALVRRDGQGTDAVLKRPSSREAAAELEAVADAIREVAWPRLAAERPPPSTFTRVGADAVVSDQGFALRMAEVGIVDYREGDNRMTLRVVRAWSPQNQMCFVVRPDALRRWDDAPPDTELPPAQQRLIEYRLAEALECFGVRFMIAAKGPATTGAADAAPAGPDRLTAWPPLPT